MRKNNVLMVQANYSYGSNVFVPYSVGAIQAYAQSVSEIRDDFQFQEPIFLRENITEVVRRLLTPAVVGFSCYLWNWEYNKRLAQAIRTAFPRCLIVFGGTQTPNASEGFFLEHPYVDLLVHNEGEFTFADILLESTCTRPDYTKISGLSVRMNDNQTLKTAPRGRINDLSKLPSPYLSGVFDFMLNRSMSLNVSWETNRGCPYTCTFCGWGGSTYAKIYSSVEERLLAELEWFGRNKVDYVFCCDANFGILSRDFELTRKMIDIRAKHGGFPKKFRMCTAKKSDDRIFDIVRLLNDADMNKGATLSFQSMDENTLKLVKRQNIKIQKFSELMRKYKNAGIATYTELILGMPGETYETSKKGIDELMEGQPDSVNIYVYVCTMLPNSEMSNPNYVELHGIKSVRMPVLLAHSTPDSDQSSLPEYTDVVIETNSMSNADWQRSYLFYWAVQAFHCLGLLQHIAIFFRKQFGVKYSDFYEKLIKHFSVNSESLIGREIALIGGIVDKASRGGRLDLVLLRFGGIYWPLEEASFLNFVIDKKRFYEEIRYFIGALAGNADHPVDPILLDDLVLYQSSVIKDPYNYKISVELQYDLHGYFDGCLNDSIKEISMTPHWFSIKADKGFDGDLESYAREIVWYSRKGGRFHHSQVVKNII